MRRHIPAKAKDVYYTLLATQERGSGTQHEAILANKKLTGND